MATTVNHSGRRQRNTVSLERALSKLGLASRSQARELILQGRVTVSGKIVTTPSMRIVPEGLAIAIDDAITGTAESLTIVLHKPRGYVTTRSDPEGRKTVYDLLGDLPHRVVPVGRLDLATSGLLILTNETQFANWLTDPDSDVDRVYLVTVEGRVAPETAERLVKGVTVDGEKMSAAAALVRKASNRESHLTVTLREGKNREVRNVLEHLGLQRPRVGVERVRLAPAELRGGLQRQPPLAHRGLLRLRDACGVATLTAALPLMRTTCEGSRHVARAMRRG